MGKRSEQVRERIRRAQDELALVRVARGDLDVIDGYVVAAGAEWLLLAVLDDAIVLDGHAALRLKDVRRIGRRGNGEMAQQALTLRGQWPPMPPAVPVDLDSVDGLLTSLMAQPVITVHPEHDDPDVCFVGAPVGLENDVLRLLELTPRAVWTRRPTKHRVDDITRVDVGGRYEDALLSVAGPPADRE
jgi:hypothetical protein